MYSHHTCTMYMYLHTCMYVYTCLSRFRNVKWSMPNNIAGPLHIRCTWAKSKSIYRAIHAMAARGLQEKPESSEDSVFDD